MELGACGRCGDGGPGTGAGPRRVGRLRLGAPRGRGLQQLAAYGRVDGNRHGGSASDPPGPNQISARRRPYAARRLLARFRPAPCAPWQFPRWRPSDSTSAGLVQLCLSPSTASSLCSSSPAATESLIHNEGDHRPWCPSQAHTATSPPPPLSPPPHPRSSHRPRRRPRSPPRRPCPSSSPPPVKLHAYPPSRPSLIDTTTSSLARPLLHPGDQSAASVLTLPG